MDILKQCGRFAKNCSAPVKKLDKATNQNPGI
jgi:hypothetical protein